ncbi:hypothetical protein ACJIZ3_014012 [Penstemon smallii]|uniref:PCI domain-containing protein n=1 Tax=Penstemon smallii TaxID=265156 RepID=A0ABD3RJ19_9LAMI
MSFGGFGKHSGPKSSSEAQTPFTQFTRPPSPVPSSEPPLKWGDIKASSSRDYDTQTYQRPPALLPLVTSNNLRTGNPAKPAEVHYKGTRSPYSQAPNEISKNSNIFQDSTPSQARSPPLAFQNNFSVGGQYPHGEVQQRPSSSTVWVNQSNPFNNNKTPPTVRDMPSISTTGGTYQSGRMFQTKSADVSLPKRTRSPTFPPTSENSPEYTFSPSDRHKRSTIDYSDLDAPEPMPSLPLAFESSFTSRDPSRHFAGIQKPSPSSPMWYQSFSNNTIPPVKEDMSSNLKTGVTYQSGRTIQTKNAEVPLPKRSRSPTLPYTTGAFPENPIFGSDAHKRAPDSQSFKQSSTSGQTITTEVAGDKPMHFPAVKKTKLPLLSSSDQAFQENLDSEEEIDRELRAKAKRLARFKDELSQPVPSYSSVRVHDVPAKRQPQSMSEKQRFPEDPIMDVTGDLAEGNVFPDYEGATSSSSIVGLCSDMCPESERAERERKGDLDQFERLDGDRNQTSEFLAVKKYNRTAEREAQLIRPMPILQKTIDYLLDLLDQPYGDRFLGLYNFLWDRMRAIRMDLRMQHIFNLEAINMLEQMIRLHIIAMHELCEYTRGEGFSEGFDAHLNIEQMNKTSVELFQLYDDHRKKGIHVPSEKEFRGYYALLKLDKHPGYKVEPAELSLDLAKMAPEMRQSSEVFFARDVARACRTGNFIAFFRLARKASYLQGCLMHAHFSKLRTQALASLHCGLQINQGIPVAHVAKWLGLEEEDIENLLEYYGFSVKDFEEPYMVKENVFINVDNDFPVKRSKLVERKRSRMIANDVSAPSLPEFYATDEGNKIRLKKDPEPKPRHLQFILPVTTTPPSDEEMHDSGTILSPKASMQRPIHVTSDNLMTLNEKITGHEIQMAPASPLVLDFSKSSSEHHESRVEPTQKPKFDAIFRNSFGRMINHDLEATLPSPLETKEEKRSPVLALDSAVNTPIQQLMFAEDLPTDVQSDAVEEDEADEVTCYDRETTEAKLKLMLRLWKRRTTKKRELREHRQLAANAALNSLSLGPPIWQYEVKSRDHGIFNIDHVMSERHEIQERSWSVLNPSDVVAPKLAGKNPDAKCLCWKMLLCSQEDTPCGENIGQENEAFPSSADSWLHSKLIPSNNNNDGDLIVSSHGLAIWKSWIPSQYENDPTCCLSVIKSSTFDNLDKSIAGTSAVLFLLSEHLPIELQKNRLHELVMLIPSGSLLPLLILSDSSNNEFDLSTITKDLELHLIDKSRVITFYIIFLKDQKMKNLDGFFSSERLREGLEWLASESPPQIVIRETRTRELVMSHLNSTLNVFDEMNDNRVDPNSCILAFNGVLDRIIKDVAAAACANPTGWPCPEIGLLEEFSDEQRAVAWYLPTIDWSSAARSGAVLSALNDSKLPTFDDDLSWLSKGLNIGDNIENHKLHLEDCIVNYLTHTTRMMGVAMAQKEANIMLQKCCRLELHNAAFYVIPKWVTIFRRIFSWRLRNLTNGEVSSTYVLVQNDLSAPNFEVMDNLGLEVSTFLPPYIVHPSLDELVEVGYMGLIHMDHEEFQTRSPMASNGADVPTSNDSVVLMEDEENSAPRNGTLVNYDSSATEVNDGVQMMYRTKASGEADKLSEMLKKCDILQNLIDKKLSVYF